MKEPSEQNTYEESELFDYLSKNMECELNEIKAEARKRLNEFIVGKDIGFTKTQKKDIIDYMRRNAEDTIYSQV